MFNRVWCVLNLKHFNKWFSDFKLRSNENSIKWKLLLGRKGVHKFIFNKIRENIIISC